MNNNNALAVLLFVVIATFTLPLFYAIADGQFYWGIAPSLVFTILYYLRTEKTKQERNETLNSSKEYQSTLENILKQNSIESQNAINSYKQENSLSQKKVQEAIEMQTIEFNKYIKIAIESLEQTISNGTKANNEQIVGLQTAVMNSILDLGKQIDVSLKFSNNKLINTIEVSFGKQEVNVSGIQEIFATNNVLIEKTIIDNNKSYKVNLDKMIDFVERFEANHKAFVENITNSQENSKDIIKQSFRSFDTSVETLSEKLDQSVEDFNKKNSRIIESFIENNQETQKAYLDNSKVILKDLNNLNKADDHLIAKLLLENDKN